MTADGKMGENDDPILPVEPPAVDEEGGADVDLAGGALDDDAMRDDTMRADAAKVPLRAAPSQAAAHLKTALERHRQGHFDAAIEMYNRVLIANPTNVQVWNNLGVAQRKLKRPHAAAAAYRRAIEIDPTWPGAWSNLGNVLKDLDDIDASLQAHEMALRLHPKSCANLHHVGIAHRLKGDHDLARELFRRAVAVDPDHVMANWDLARQDLLFGDYVDGWNGYEWRWKLAEMKIRTDLVRPRWDGGSLKGKTVLLYAEQGFGDTLLGLRFVPWVKSRGATVILECQPALKRLIQDLDAIDVLIERGATIPDHDVQSSLMSLPRLFGLTLDTLPPPPPLHVPAAEVARLAPLFRTGVGKLKVGIVWSGSVTFKNNGRRAVGLDRFLKFAAHRTVQLYSLQKGPPQAELAALGCPPMVIDVGRHCTDFADTAAALQHLDLVVMTDSSVAHLCGCLDKPIWNLVDVEAYWLYLHDREDSPWYPSMRLFRQTSFGDWDGVFERADKALIAAGAAAAAGRTPQLLPWRAAREGRS